MKDMGVDRRKNSPVLTDGKYDAEKIYNLVEKENVAISYIEFKYGIHRSDIIRLINEHGAGLEENKNNKSFIVEGQVVEANYIHDYSLYKIKGTIIKKYLNSVIIEWLSGDELPAELLNKAVVPIKQVIV